MSVDRPRQLVAGNWKMNGLQASRALFSEIAALYGPALKASVDLVVCPPATLVHILAREAAGTQIAVGGQDCHAQPSGAFTGDIAAEMLADAGANFVILGHSERRQYHGEKNADVRAKALAAHRAGLTAIICIGETKEERERGKALDVVARQLEESVPEGSTSANLVIAYEPVWAIGTGLTATPADVAEVHALIRENLGGLVGQENQSAVRILYGGSVKPDNAKELLGVPNVDGALVGGASLKASDFMAIAREAT